MPVTVCVAPWKKTVPLLAVKLAVVDPLGLPVMLPVPLTVKLVVPVIDTEVPAWMVPELPMLGVLIARVPSEVNSPVPLITRTGVCEFVEVMFITALDAAAPPMNS